MRKSDFKSKRLKFEIEKLLNNKDAFENAKELSKIAKSFKSSDAIINYLTQIIK